MSSPTPERRAVLDPTMKTYPICACGCGCEPDGEWHYEGGIGCRCVSLGCPCVTDQKGLAK